PLVAVPMQYGDKGDRPNVRWAEHRNLLWPPTIGSGLVIPHTVIIMINSRKAAVAEAVRRYPRFPGRCTCNIIKVQVISRGYRNWCHRHPCYPVIVQKLWPTSTRPITHCP